MLFKNILVPFDDSKCSLHAVKVAIDIAKNYKSKITVATCIPKSYDTGNWYTDHRYVEAMNKKRIEEVTKSFKKPENIARKQKIPVKTQILKSDSIVKELASYAKSNKVDLIVIGTRGKTAWNKLILGSVASGISQNVHCPVLLVR